MSTLSDKFKQQVRNEWPIAYAIGPMVIKEIEKALGDNLDHEDTAEVAARAGFLAGRNYDGSADSFLNDLESEVFQNYV